LPEPKKRVGSAPVLPSIVLNKKEIDTIVASATKSVAQKMGVKEDQLPASVKTAIKTATTNAIETRTKAIIQRDVDKSVKDTILKGVSPLDMLDTRVIAAKEGIAHIRTDPNVDSVLQDTSTLLWKKFNALKTAGFSETQAFDLLLAEVQGRASRRA